MAQKQGLWGPSPDEVQQYQRDQERASINQADGTLAGSTAKLGATAGQALGNIVGGLGGFKDPMMQKALLMEEAKQEVESTGVDLIENPMDYYKASAQALAKRGLMNEAMQVQEIIRVQSQQQAELQFKQEQLKNERLKERYQSVGKGGLLDTATGKVIEPATKDDDKPGTTQGKIVGDYNKGMYGEVGSPQAIAMRDDALAKANYMRPPDGSTVVIKGEEQRNKVFGTGVSERALNLIDSVQRADEISDQANRTMELVQNSPALTGPGSEIELGLAKMFNIMGADNEDTIAATQAMMSELAGTTLKAIPDSNLGGGQGFTERDKQFLINASAGDFTWSKESLAYLASVQSQRAYNMTKKYNDWYNSLYPEYRADLERLNGFPLRPRRLPKIIPRPKWNASWDNKNNTKTEKPTAPSNWTKDPMIWEKLSPRAKEAWLQRNKK